MADQARQPHRSSLPAAVGFGGGCLGWTGLLRLKSDKVQHFSIRPPAFPPILDRTVLDGDSALRVAFKAKLGALLPGYLDKAFKAHSNRQLPDAT
jgi:hypothetical protein